MCNSDTSVGSVNRDESAGREELLRSLPGVDRLLGHPRLRGLEQRIARSYLVRIVRDVIEGRRERILAGRVRRPAAVEALAALVCSRVEALSAGRMRRVINASGVVLHTGLGRAALPERVRTRLNEVLAGYCDLEYELDSGRRGRREERVRGLLKVLTGAEDALVCNNNAAAVYLMLNTLCNRRGVVVSRGQQVEIGGGFRIPDVVRRSGCRLVEVGTTNRTHLRDYAEALTPGTAALLRVHSSNFKIVGFTSEVPLAELAELSRERGVLLLDDLGSGALVDFPGVERPEPLVAASLEAGADLVSFSGDKLLGGPQAGIVLGRRELVRRLARNPMMRALRCDKMSLAALEAVLQVSLEAGDRPAELPAFRMLTEPREAVRKRARRLAELLEDRLEEENLRLVDSVARTGSGALPEQDLPSAALRIGAAGGSAEQLHRRLRLGRPAVVCRVRDEALLVDLKTVDESELPDLAAALTAVLGDAAKR